MIQSHKGKVVIESTDSELYADLATLIHVIYLGVFANNDIDIEIARNTVVEVILDSFKTEEEIELEEELGQEYMLDNNIRMLEDILKSFKKEREKIGK